MIKELNTKNLDNNINYDIVTACDYTDIVFSYNKKLTVFCDKGHNAISSERETKVIRLNVDGNIEYRTSNAAYRYIDTIENPIIIGRFDKDRDIIVELKYLEPTRIVSSIKSERKMSEPTIMIKLRYTDEPVLVGDWAELSEFKESDTHTLKVNVEMDHAYLQAKDEKNYIPDKDYMQQIPNLSVYLTTHTFYESQYKYATKILQACGFNVELESWG